MATATRFQKGDCIDYTPNTAKTAGNVVVVGTIVGVVDNDIAADRLGALSISGIYKVPKEDSSTEFAAGAAVYWDVADDEANSDSGNPFMGKAAVAAGATDAYVYVVLLTAQAAVAEALGLANLSDVESATPTDGNLLVGDGDSFEPSKLEPRSVKVETGGITACPIHLFVNATATGLTTIPKPAIKLRIVDAFYYQRATTASDIDIVNAGSTATRAAVSSGTTADVRKQLEITDAQYTVLSTSTLQVNLSTAYATGIEVHVLAVPIS